MTFFCFPLSLSTCCSGFGRSFFFLFFFPDLSWGTTGQEKTGSSFFFPPFPGDYSVFSLFYSFYPLMAIRLFFSLSSPEPGEGFIVLSPGPFQVVIEPTPPGVLGGVFYTFSFWSLAEFFFDTPPPRGHPPRFSFILRARAGQSFLSLLSPRRFLYTRLCGTGIVKFFFLA